MYQRMYQSQQQVHHFVAMEIPERDDRPSGAGDGATAPHRPSVTSVTLRPIDRAGLVFPT